MGVPTRQRVNMLTTTTAVAVVSMLTTVWVKALANVVTC